MSFPKYEAYKDSGVEWLGEVPVHWNVSSLKWLSPVLRGASPRPIEDPKYFEDEGEYGWVRIADVSASNGHLFETTQRLSPLGSSLSVKLEPESLFLSIAGSVGKPCITKIKACIHDGFVYFPQLSINHMLLYRIFENGLCFGGLGKMGTQLNLNTETVGGIRIPLPPSDELNKVLNFLDHETARIDALITQQQRLIELLKEKRQAVISHAVTKGLDPTAPMKDSGVEWLGEVPDHWGVSRVGWQCFVGNGCTPSRENLDYWNNGDYPWLNSSNVNLEKIVKSDQFVTKKALSECALPVVKSKSVLMAITGEGKTRGMVTITEIEVTISQHLAFIECKDKNLNHHFLHDWLSANYLRIRHKSEGWGSTKAAITCGDIRAFPLPLPPVSEQREICKFINEKSSLLNKLVSQSEVNILLLQERRSALISAAVTGQIDVRGWQAPVSPVPTLEAAYG